MGTILNIPVPKAGAGVTVPIDIDDAMDLPPETLREIMFQGLKNVLNRGQSKEASAKNMEGEAAAEQKEKVLAVVSKQWDLCVEGKVRVSGGRASTKGTDKAYHAEAMRYSIAIIKDAIKRNGEKVSHYLPKDIKQAAEMHLQGEDGPAIMALAKEAVDKRNAQKAEAKKIDLSGLKPDEALVKKAEGKKKKKGEEGVAGIAAAVAATKKGQSGFGLRH